MAASFSSGVNSSSRVPEIAIVVPPPRWLKVYGPVGVSSVSDIFDVEIVTRLADVPKIKLDCVGGTVFLEFVRHTVSHSLNLFWGDSGWVFSELASYTSYWASLLTARARDSS